jgi:hypothetical protein
MASGGLRTAQFSRYLLERAGIYDEIFSAWVERFG